LSRIAMIRDAQGHVVAAASAEAVCAFDHVIENSLTYCADAAQRLVSLIVAGPEFGLVHILKRYLVDGALLPRAQQAWSAVCPDIRHGTPRERAHAEALALIECNKGQASSRARFSMPPLSAQRSSVDHSDGEEAMFPKPLAGRWALAFGLVLYPLSGQAQQHSHNHAAAPPAASTLGSVHFPVTCSPAAQAAFDEAMKLQHSFWYEAAGTAFRHVREQDPACAMALWGEAMALLVNPFTVTTAANLRQGRALLGEAQRIGAKSERERGFIAALVELYGNEDPGQHRARLERYEQAMGQLYARFPEDPEVGIHYALALSMAAAPTDKTYARQIRAAEILEREATRQPQHPGVAHYLIHTYDVPALAQRGLPAAERYAHLAADAPHALHMPSHIFTRVGRWEQSIETNLRSADTARARGAVFDEIHALDYLVYGYLQTGKTEAARRVLAELPRFVDWQTPAPIFAWALTVMPARYALERGAWAEAAALEPGRQTAPLVVANTHFARAIGMARSGRPEAAAPDIEALKAASAALQGRDAYWQEQIEILRLSAEGWAAFAEGRQDAALASIREATLRERRTDKHPITPGPLMPAGEQLAEMLMLMGRHAEAQREFLAVQETEPRRFRAVYGAARAAEMTGDRDLARQQYLALLDIARTPDAPKPELEQARMFVAQP
jgi:tetratricopeptide (TPR) repeat protein